MRELADASDAAAACCCCHCCHCGHCCCCTWANMSPISLRTQTTTTTTTRIVNVSLTHTRAPAVYGPNQILAYWSSSMVGGRACVERGRSFTKYTISIYVCRVRRRRDGLLGQ